MILFFLDLCSNRPNQNLPYYYLISIEYRVTIVYI